jgi:hypothetical protein
MISSGGSPPEMVYAPLKTSTGTSPTSIPSSYRRRALEASILKLTRYPFAPGKPRLFHPSSKHSHGDSFDVPSPLPTELPGTPTTSTSIAPPVELSRTMPTSSSTITYLGRYGSPLIPLSELIIYPKKQMEFN